MRKFDTTGRKFYCAGNEKDHGPFTLDEIRAHNDECLAAQYVEARFNSRRAKSFADQWHWQDVAEQIAERSGWTLDELALDEVARELALQTALEV